MRFTHIRDQHTQLRRIARRDMRRMRRSTQRQFARAEGFEPWWTGEVSLAGLPLLRSDCPPRLLLLQHTSRALRRERVTHLEAMLTRRFCGGGVASALGRPAAPVHTPLRRRPRRRNPPPGGIRHRGESFVAAMCRFLFETPSPR